MYFRQLRYFVAVAETGQFTAAAERVNISQPALGMQVKKLEDELGAPLLNRHSRGVELTPAGEVLLLRAREIMAKIEDAKQAVIDAAGRIAGELKVGLTPTMGRLIPHPLMEACKARYPDLQLSFTQGYSDELRTDLLADKLNLAFSYEVGSDERLIASPLLSDQFYLVGPEELLGQEEEIRFADLQNYPLVLEKRLHSTQRLLMDVAARRGVALNAAIEVDPINIRRELLVNHASCTVVPYALFSTEIDAGYLRAQRVVNPKFERTLLPVAGVAAARRIWPRPRSQMSSRGSSKKKSLKAAFAGRARRLASHRSDIDVTAAVQPPPLERALVATNRH